MTTRSPWQAPARARWLQGWLVLLVAVAWTGCADDAPDPDPRGIVPLGEWLSDCTPGEARCLDLDVAVCPATGGTARVVACDEGLACDVAAPGGPWCTAEVCVDETTVCLDDTTRGICGGAGERRVHAPCPPGQTCDGGVCASAPTCGRADAWCDGDVRTVCGVDGTLRSRDCRAGCESEFGCACADGGCFERVCAAGARRCVDGIPERCAGDGRGWVEAPACGELATCMAGACVDATCDDSDLPVCVGDHVVTCVDGQPVAEDCRGETARCADRGGVAWCEPMACIPGVAVCIGGERYECAPTGDRRVLDACPAHMTCEAGACVTRACGDDGAPLCAGQHVLGCADDAWTVVATCDAGERCADGACVPTTCPPGVRQCVSDDRAAVCVGGEDPATAWASRYCPLGCNTGTGTCNEPVCEFEGTLVCRDGALLACEDHGGRLTWSRDCASPGCTDPGCGGLDLADAEPCVHDGNCRSGNCSNGLCSPRGHLYLPPTVIDYRVTVASPPDPDELFDGPEMHLHRGMWVMRRPVHVSDPLLTREGMYLGEYDVLPGGWLSVDGRDAARSGDAWSRAEGLETWDECRAIGAVVGLYDCEGYRLLSIVEHQWLASGGRSGPFSQPGVSLDDDPSTSRWSGWERYAELGAEDTYWSVRPNPWGAYHVAGQPPELRYLNVWGRDDDVVTEPVLYRAEPRSIGGPWFRWSGSWPAAGDEGELWGGTATRLARVVPTRAADDEADEEDP